ncbi:hypothetical protein [Alteromonas sp. CYL-A6]|uniref:hypothetical protein n=1 Tax=Alteromonas nitratireducens TaxID=3390813 RepID=UPI0034B56694
MTKALFVIDTPMQVSNLQEALQVFSIDHYDIITVDVSRADGYAQLQQQLTRLNPGRLINVPRIEGDIRARVAAYARHLPWLKAQHYDHVFFSNIRQHWQRDIVCSLDVQSPVLMDDGNSTVMLYALRFRQGLFFDFPVDNDIQRVTAANEVREEFGVSTEQPRHLTLFTIFKLEPLPWLDIVPNPMSLMRVDHHHVNDEQVMIMGTGAVALDYISLEEYIRLLNGIAARFPGKQFIYQPHRITAQALLDVIERETGFTVKRLDCPVEVWLAGHDCPPATLVSFFSAALSTCSLCFPAIHVVSATPDISAWEAARHAHVFHMPGTDNLQIISLLLDYLKTDPRIETLLL